MGSSNKYLWRAGPPASSAVSRRSDFKFCEPPKAEVRDSSKWYRPQRMCCESHQTEQADTNSIINCNARNFNGSHTTATQIISSSSSSSSSASTSSTAPLQEPGQEPLIKCSVFIIISKNLLALLVCTIICWRTQLANSASSGERMVRLCIASVDPIKLSSQCVMCNRREFPLTVIDCTGITKVNDLIANPLSVQEATCLIYNCRRQVPDVKPEPYHGSVSHAVNYRSGMSNVGGGGGGGAASNYNYHGLPASGMAGPASGSSIYEIMTPSGMFGSGYSMQPSLLSHPQQQSQSHTVSQASPFMTRFGLGYRGANSYSANPAASVLSPLASLVPKGLIGGPNLMPNRQQALPYAIVPAAPGFPFGESLQRLRRD